MRSTARAWETSSHPERMLALHPPRDDRKGRLFLAGCCRAVWDLLPGGSQFAVAVAERWADGQADRDERDEARDRADIAATEADGLHQMCSRALEAAEQELLPDPSTVRLVELEERYLLQGRVLNAAMVAHAAVFERLTAVEFGHAVRTVDGPAAGLLRCVYGNPFRPVAFDPGWRTPSAVALARTIYEARDFAHLPILADALDDAGCDQPDVIGHRRGPGPHARGCWVVEAVLGHS